LRIVRITAYEEGGIMLHRVLSAEQEALLQEERRRLSDLLATLGGLNVAQEDQATLRRAMRGLDELFLLVVVGEFNSGKSAIINALLGQDLLQEGVTPTTAQIHLVRYGEAQEQRLLEEGIWSIAAPVEILREINLVDTPGTNAIIRRHEAITEEFIPRSDLVLFVTSADRPFTESERLFLQRIRDWGKKVTFIVNKIDILESEGETAQVVDFVTENAQATLNVTSKVFPVSARLAARAKATDDRAMWERSHFAPLELYIMDTLDEAERLRLKLSSPLGVGTRLAEQYLGQVGERLTAMQADFQAIEDLEGQLDLYRQDMYRDFRFRLSDAENLLIDLDTRGMDFFDEMLRLARVFDLLDQERVKTAFLRQVVADTPQKVEERVSMLIDWLVDSEARQWKAVSDHLGDRRREHQGRIVGALESSYEANRGQLLDTVGRAAQQVVDSYDREAEAAELAEAARFAVAEAAAVEAGAVGLGTILVLAVGTAAADVTGILAASVIATLGLFIIPSRRREAKSRLRERITGLRQRLVGGLTAQFERELERSLQRISEAVAPYVRFVRSERERLESAQDALKQSLDALHALKSQVESLERE
jgi:small GTP-binding protein